VSYRVESKEEFQAIIARGQRPNHLLHLILTVLTLGLWLVGWIIVAVTGGVRRRIITVNELGDTAISQEARGA
jgi:hypothetical protein